MRKLNLVGERYGRLLVIKQGKVENGRTYSICQCDCGNIVEVMNKSLRSGITCSCGCLKKDNARKLGLRTGKDNIKKALPYAHKKNTTHGKTKDRLYKIYQSIHQRCENKNSTGWKYYGAKGITVCKEWNNFINFNNWALENGYTDDLTIDRINPNKGYCPENCRWVTKSENSQRAGEQNRRYWAIDIDNGHYIEFSNLTHFLESIDYKISYSRAQDMIRGKSKSYNGWIIGKD